jgi:hypothetical protein
MRALVLSVVFGVFIVAVHAVCPAPQDAVLTKDLLLDGNTAFAAALAAAASTNDGNCDVIVTFANKSWLSMFNNLLISMDNVSIQKVLVIALSDGVCDHNTPVRLSVTCFRYPLDFEATFWGTAVFRQLSYMKVEVELAAVALGYHTLIVDSDIVMLKNPLEELRGRLPSGVDLQIQTDDFEMPAPGSFHLNTGFMFMTASARMAQLLRRTLDVCRSPNNTLMDQPVMNNVIRASVQESSDFKYHVRSRHQQHAALHVCIHYVSRRSWM